MIIDLDKIDREQFMVHEHILNGELVHLVQPQHIGCKWTQANKHFRSSVWNDQGELISASFPKFVNWGENPEHFPVPSSLKNTTVVEKIDGSTLIVSKYKGNYILRTRGTVDASKLDNGYELEIFKEKYLSKLEEVSHTSMTEGDDTWQWSFLFEWVSPKNRIVINYGDNPDWYLVGMVHHTNYSLWQQKDLDYIAKVIGCLRPNTYQFPSLQELMSTVEQWKDKEGVVIYSHDLHKAKGFWYLALHRMKSELSSIDKVIDVWYEHDEPTYTEFENLIITKFDYELWTQIRGFVSRICDASTDVKHIVDGMQKFVNDTLLPMGNPQIKADRAKIAKHVISAYSVSNRANMVFSLLDGNKLTPDQKKKLLYQCLKK